MGIGARVWKTALAVAVALAISHLLRLDHPVFAGVAAIICMQPTVAGTLRSGRERMQATVIGAIFSLAALALLEYVPWLQFVRPAVVGATVVVVMAVTIRLRWFDSLVLAAATVVVIMVLPSEESIYSYSATRTGVTFIGILVATAVNALFLTPRHRRPLWRRLQETASSTSQLYRQAVEAFCYRKLDLAQRVQAALAETAGLQDAVTTRMQWLEDESKLRHAIHWREEQEVDVLRRAADAVLAIRKSAATIAQVAEEVLTQRPSYADEPARVYEILWDLSQLSFTILERAEERLSGAASSKEQPTRTWTEEVHRNLVRAIRQAYTAPKDIFPLVEVCVVAFEIRRATELAAEFARAVESHVS